MKDKALIISGGSTKISFLAGVGISLNENKKYHYYVGISSGAILSLPLALGLNKEIEENVLNFTIDDIFHYSEKTFWGKFRIIKNILSGKNHIYDQTKLLETLGKIITKERFKEWQDKGFYSPEVMVVCVNFETGEEVMFSLKEMTYENAMLVILASASIPVAANYVTFDNKKYYDGGLRSHIPSAKFIRCFNSKVDEIDCIYSRPKDLSKIRYTFPKSKWFSFNIFSVFKRSYDILLYELSKSDEKETDLLCEKYDIKHNKYFSPYMLTSKLYETSKELNHRWFNYGKTLFSNHPH